jgi:hypothetical protein
MSTVQGIVKSMYTTPRYDVAFNRMRTRPVDLRGHGDVQRARGGATDCFVASYPAMLRSPRSTTTRQVEAQTGIKIADGSVISATLHCVARAVDCVVLEYIAPL